MRYLVLFLLAGCPTTNTPVVLQPLSDAAIASVDTACANLVKVSCYVTTETCAAGVGNLVQAGLAPVDLSCATTATSRDAAGKCVGISCP